jgi:mannose-1-phosphate guanylyltransferase
MQIIIVAGGGGTRLWPLSTKEKPKQFIPIFGETSLLRKTYDIVRQGFFAENIWVITNKNYLELTKTELSKEFEEKRIILEPEKRDSFAAVTAAGAIIAKQTSQKEVLVFIPCDDYLSNTRSVENFVHGLKKLEEPITSGSFDLITTGIRPTYPSTQYGYIELKESDKWRCFQEVVPVVSFKEKPDEKTAENYLDKGNYIWNKFNFSFTYESLTTILKKTNNLALPVLNKIFELGAMNDELFLQLKKVAFDYEVVEHAENFGVLCLDIDWDDVGNWETVYKYLEELDGVNSVEVDGSHNKIMTSSRKKVAFVGVSNLLYVENEKGVLIVDPRNTQSIKKVAELLDI